MSEKAVKTVWKQNAVSLLTEGCLQTGLNICEQMTPNDEVMR